MKNNNVTPSLFAIILFSALCLEVWATCNWMIEEGTDAMIVCTICGNPERQRTTGACTATYYDVDDAVCSCTTSAYHCGSDDSERYDVMCWQITGTCNPLPPPAGTGWICQSEEPPTYLPNTNTFLHSHTLCD